jgi:hypothetical protein
MPERKLRHREGKKLPNTIQLVKVETRTYTFHQEEKSGLVPHSD